MKKLKPIWEEKVVYSGRNFEVIQQEYQVWEKVKLFEIAKRAPWVRLFIVDSKENKILLSKEYRTELEEFDYRLPWWKVFDTPEQRQEADYSQIEKYAEKAALFECEEETGLIVKNLQLFWISHAWATVKWDLYYFLVDDFSVSEGGQKLWTWEVITTDWYSMKELIELCKNGNIKEDRSLWMIFKFLLERGELN